SGNFTAGDVYTIHALSTDNATNTVQAAQTFTYDTTAPTVSSITSTTASGSYKAGTVIPVTVNFSEPVVVTGTPQLTLNTAPNETLNYCSGTRTTALTLNHTVQPGDTQAAAPDNAATAARRPDAGTHQGAATN